MTEPDKPSSGGQFIKDYLLANTAMAAHIDPHSYRVYHSGDGFDHDMVKAAFDLSREFS